MTIVFDLDYTLLDTVKFKEALRDAVTSFGISPERYEETYKQIVKREGKAYDYDPDVHIESLKADLRDPALAGEAKARIDQVLSRSEEFLYPGSVEMLAKYREAGARLVLLTLGNPHWQEAKVRHSGLAGMFDQVYAVGKDKVGVLRGLAAEDDEVIVVNDNGIEVKEMLQEVEKWKSGKVEMPKIHFLLKKGPKASPPDLDLKALELDEVEKAIDAEMGLDVPREDKEARLNNR